jgi:hypothetical protein
MEVIFQDADTDLVQGCLNSIDLPDDINTICLFLHHSFHAPDVALNSLQSSQIGNGLFHSNTPPWGVGYYVTPFIPYCQMGIIGLLHA